MHTLKADVVPRGGWAPAIEQSAASSDRRTRERPGSTPSMAVGAVATSTLIAQSAAGTVTSGSAIDLSTVHPLHSPESPVSYSASLLRAGPEGPTEVGTHSFDDPRRCINVPSLLVCYPRELRNRSFRAHSKQDVDPHYPSNSSECLLALSEMRKDCSCNKNLQYSADHL